MSDTVRQLEELAQNWTATELRGDTTFLESALTDDFVGIWPRGFMLTKEQWLARFGSRGLRYESFGMDEVRRASTESRDRHGRGRAGSGRVDSLRPERGEPHVIPWAEGIFTLLIYLLVDVSPPDLAIPSKAT